MRVTLTENPADSGEMFSLQSGNDCDCTLAFPTDADSIPVLSLPISYYLELTPGCNNRCPGCGNVYADRAAPGTPTYCLDVGGWCALVSRLASHAQHFTLTGGEPTLHPGFPEIVRAIEGCGVSFNLFTNGRWHSPPALLRLLGESSACDGMLVSLHGPDAPTHEAFSGVAGSFEETAANIRRAADAGIDVAVNLVITRYNWNSIEETLALALSLGAGCLVCNRLIGASGCGICPTDAQLREAVVSVESLRAGGRPVRFGNCIPQCFEPSSSVGCAAGSTFATIDPWGRMRPCNHAPIVAGDVVARPVEEVWRGRAMEYWRSLVPPGCAGCAAFSACRGGCRAQALSEGCGFDPLACGVPDAAPPHPFREPELVLYAGLRPRGLFTCRVHRPDSGEDVLILVRRSRVAMVPPGYDGVLQSLDGSMTLSQAGQRYGSDVVDWIGGLYRHGMIAWG